MRLCNLWEDRDIERLSVFDEYFQVIDGFDIDKNDKNKTEDNSIYYFTTIKQGLVSYHVSHLYLLLPYSIFFFSQQ